MAHGHHARQVQAQRGGRVHQVIRRGGDILQRAGEAAAVLAHAPVLHAPRREAALRQVRAQVARVLQAVLRAPEAAVDEEHHRVRALALGLAQLGELLRGLAIGDARVGRRLRRFQDPHGAHARILGTGGAAPQAAPRRVGCVGDGAPVRCRPWGSFACARSNEAELRMALAEGLLSREDAEALREEAARRGVSPFQLLVERGRISVDSLVSLREEHGVAPGEEGAATSRAARNHASRSRSRASEQRQALINTAVGATRRREPAARPSAPRPPRLRPRSG